jgi:hypothetical protein
MPVSRLHLNIATLVNLLAVHAPCPLHQLCGVVYRTECAPCGVYALHHQPARNDNPESIHQDKVSPVVSGLGARVRHVENVMIEHGGCVVENVAVELTEGDDELEGVAERVVVGDETGGDEGKGAPEGLS